MTQALAGSDHSVVGLPRRTASVRREKLFRARRGVNSIVVLITLALASGCFRPPRAIPELPAGDWRTRLGDAAHAPFLDERVPERVHVVWEESLGRGVAAMPIVQDALIIAVVTGGGLVTAAAGNGERYWSRRYNGAIAGQALRAGERVFFATQHRNGDLYALNLRRGRRAWSRDLDARPTAEPALHGGVLYVPTDRGTITAVSAETGAIMWRAKIAEGMAQPPVISGRGLLLVTSGDTLFGMDLETRSITGRHAIAGVASAPLALRGDTVVIATHDGIVAAYVDGGARELWRHDADAPVLAAPVITPRGVYILNRRGQIFRITDGRAALLADLSGAASESLTVAANGLLVGLLDGSLIFIDNEGREVWREQLTGSIRAPAALAGGSIYAATLRGRLVKLGS